MGQKEEAAAWAGAKRIRDTAAKALREGEDYIAAYRRLMDDWVDHDPQLAVGGLWDELGGLQQSFLVRHGLSPASTLLDIGCGTLRFGRFAIAYLDAKGYAGFDMSPKAIAFALGLVEAEGLAAKRPLLFVNKSARLDFEEPELTGRRFDFLWAQSVFTHLAAEHIDTCFSNLHKVMHSSSQFYFTYDDTDHFDVTAQPAFLFYYPFSFFADMALRHGLTIARCPDYVHPRKQSLLCATKGA